MTNATADANVYVVDDDLPLRRSLSVLLEQAGYVVKSYARAEDFLREAVDCNPGCLLIDLCLPGMSGLDLQRAVRDEGLPLSVVAMSSNPDLPLALTAVRLGALDFVKKPFSRTVILDRVREALADSQRRCHGRNAIADLRRRFESLTPREREVMRLMVEGQPTKIAARQLGVSPRTVETHRIRVMRKMGVRTLSMLVRQGLALEAPGEAGFLLPADAARAEQPS
ncbi:MAG TPA: response regulator [Alphaproteobacteria bacterium]|nr:response regulator [Alphaproteobacteria bacterium]